MVLKQLKRLYRGPSSQKSRAAPFINNVIQSHIHDGSPTPASGNIHHNLPHDIENIRNRQNKAYYILPQQDFLHYCGRIKHKIIHTTQGLPTTKVHFRFAVTFWYSSCVHCVSSCHAFLKPDGIRTGLDTEDESHQHPWRLPSTYWQGMPPPDISNRIKQKT